MMDGIAGWKTMRVRAAAGEAIDANRGVVFAGLADAHLDAACRLATVILGGDRVEAEDAVQDAALRAWQHFGDLRDLDRFEPWFTHIVVNACRDHIRARRVRPISAMELDLELELGVERDHGEVVSETDALARAIQMLSPEHRIIVALRYLGDCSLDEIATRTGQRTGTVKSRLHYGLRALRAALDAQAREVSR